MRTCLRLIAISLLAGAAWAADITGTWSFNVDTPAGSGTPTFVFEQKGEALTGTYQGALGEARLAGSVKGDKVEFAFEINAGGQSVKVEYSGVIESATKMKGKGKYSELGDATWTATKK